MELPELIDERGAAKALAVATRTLQWWRTSGTGPRFVKIGRAVRYRKADLVNWIEAGTRENTLAMREVRHG